MFQLIYLHHETSHPNTFRTQNRVWRLRDFNPRLFSRTSDSLVAGRREWRDAIQAVVQAQPAGKKTLTTLMHRLREADCDYLFHVVMQATDSEDKKLLRWMVKEVGLDLDDACGGLVTYDPCTVGELAEYQGAFTPMQVVSMTKAETVWDFMEWCDLFAGGKGKGMEALTSKHAENCLPWASDCVTRWLVGRFKNELNARDVYRDFMYRCNDFGMECMVQALPERKEELETIHLNFLDAKESLCEPL